jgi:hypothetical protein
VKLNVLPPPAVIVPEILQKLTVGVVGGSAEMVMLNPAGRLPAMIVQVASVPEPPLVGIRIVYVRP